MPAVAIPWPTTSLPGREPGESQGLLVNAYAAKIGQEIRIRRLAGLKPYLSGFSTPEKIPRGQLAVNEILLHAWDGNLFAHRVGSNVNALNGLPGTQPVTMAHNLRLDGIQVAIVTEDGASAYDIATNSVMAYPSAGLGGVNSVEYYSGYFFFTRLNGEVLASELQQLEVLPGSIMNAEYTADKLYRTKSIGNALAVMSASSVEFWVDVASSPFPCQRQNTLDVGLLAPFAVAGGVNEWENGLLWVAGDWTVRRLNGYQAEIVSTDDVVRDIRDCFMQGGEFRAQVYVFNAQAIWSLTTPYWTWEYNVSTGAWHKHHSGSLYFWRGAFGCNYQGRWIVQLKDSPVNKLSEVSPNVFDEEGERLKWMVESAPLKEFPANYRIPSIDIDMTVGLGGIDRPSPYETDPTVMVSWSHDGGANWSNPVARSMGREGRYATKVTVNNLGRSTSRGVMFRLEVTDPVWVQLSSGIVTRAKMSRARAVNA